MLIIDGDYPMAFGALELNRDLTLSVHEIRRAAPDRFAQEGYPDRDTMASLPELRKARFAAALVKVVGRVPIKFDQPNLVDAAVFRPTRAAWPGYLLKSGLRPLVEPVR